MALACPGYVCSLGLSTLCPDPNPKSSRLAEKHEKIIQEMEGKSTVLVGVPCFRGREPQRTIHLGPGRRLRRFSGLRSVTSGATARVEVLRYLALRQGCDKALGFGSVHVGKANTVLCNVVLEMWIATRPVASKSVLKHSPTRIICCEPGLAQPAKLGFNEFGLMTIQILLSKGQTAKAMEPGNG